MRYNLKQLDAFCFQSSLRPKARADAIKRFQLPHSKDGSIRIIVGSIELLKTGLDLDGQCQKVIVTGPTNQYSDLLQFSSRISREGESQQRAARKPTCKVLIDPVGIELTIYRCMTFRSLALKAEITVEQFRRVVAQAEADEAKEIQPGRDVVALD